MEHPKEQNENQDLSNELDALIQEQLSGKKLDENVSKKIKTIFILQKGKKFEDQYSKLINTNDPDYIKYKIDLEASKIRDILGKEIIHDPNNPNKDYEEHNIKKLSEIITNENTDQYYLSEIKKDLNLQINNTDDLEQIYEQLIRESEKYQYENTKSNQNTLEYTLRDLFALKEIRKELEDIVKTLKK